MNPSELIGVGGVACCACALALATWTVVRESQSVLHRGWKSYSAALERQLCRLFVFRPGHEIPLAQLALLFGTGFGALLLSWPVAWCGGLALATLVGPALWLRSALRRRASRIDQQVEAFLVCTANALKSRPAVGDALASVLELTPNPLRQELELAVKQMHVGCTVDEALLEMSIRVGGRNLDTALSAILIGRQVGGHLPTVLETTAAAMREMDRLEGVIKTKTAQERSQLWVLALFPAVLVLAFNWISRGYFDPMTASVAGCLATGLALTLWGGSLVAARRILAVDI
jgi:tight adherence protein B